MKKRKETIYCCITFFCLSYPDLCFMTSDLTCDSHLGDFSDCHESLTNSDPANLKSYGLFYCVFVYKNLGLIGPVNLTRRYVIVSLCGVYEILYNIIRSVYKLL